MLQVHGPSAQQCCGRKPTQTAQQQRVVSSAATTDASGSAMQMTDPSTSFPYLPLDISITDGPLSSHLQLGVHASSSSSTGVVEQLLTSLMQANPGITPSRLKSTIGLRIQDKMLLLDNPTARLSARRAFSRRSATTFSASLLSGKQLRKLKRAAHKKERHPTYEQLQPVHDLWQTYVAGVMSAAPADAAAALLALDLHGALLRVCSSVHPSHQGVCGRVASITSKAVQLVTLDHRLHIVPMPGSIFEYDASATQRVTLLGNGYKRTPAAAAPKQS